MLGALLVGLALLVPLSAHAQISTIVGGNSAGPTFTGVGDAVSSNFKSHWGLIAPTAAQRGQNIVELCNVGDVACANVATDATTGLVSSTQVVGAITCGSGANLCTIKTAYDPGGTYCSGSPCPLSQATEGSRPTFVPNCSGSVPCMACNGSQNLTGTFAETAVPASIAAGSSTSVDPGANHRIVGTNGIMMLHRAGPKQAFYAGGAAFAETASAGSTGTIYALVGGVDGSGNGQITRNGTKDTGTVGTTSSGTTIALCSAPDGSNKMTGQIVEAAVWAANLSDGEVTSVTSALRTNGGY